MEFKREKFIGTTDQGYDFVFILGSHTCCFLAGGICSNYPCGYSNRLHESP